MDSFQQAVTVLLVDLDLKYTRRGWEAADRGANMSGYVPERDNPNQKTRVFDRDAEAQFKSAEGGSVQQVTQKTARPRAKAGCEVGVICQGGPHLDARVADGVGFEKRGGDHGACGFGDRKNWTDKMAESRTESERNGNFWVDRIVAQTNEIAGSRSMVVNV